VRIGLIAHGAMPIPPSGWGAVEGTIWNFKLYLERAGHIVDIFNTRHIHSVLHAVNRGAYDFVHCHNEMFVLQCVSHLKLPFAVTSHTAVNRLPSGEYNYAGATKYLFKDTLQAPANIVLSEQIKEIYLRAGYKGLLRVLRNGVACENFTLSEHGNGRAICVGRILRRKRQAWLSEIVADRVAVDFVGPWDRTKESTFAESATAKYLGVWDRQTLYERLSDYSCLVLLSSAEGAPMVVPEAFAAGLSVVITEACAANLTKEDFIAVVPDDERRPEIIAGAIRTAIEKNAALRTKIRRYALEHFDYSVVCRDYVLMIEQARDILLNGPRRKGRRWGFF
jgi:glycosyltransferase involved in cell wall biosynthesis